MNYSAWLDYLCLSAENIIAMNNKAQHKSLINENETTIKSQQDQLQFSSTSTLSFSYSKLTLPSEFISADEIKCLIPDVLVSKLRILPGFIFDSLKNENENTDSKNKFSVTSISRYDESRYCLHIFRICNTNTSEIASTLAPEEISPFKPSKVIQEKRKAYRISVRSGEGINGHIEWQHAKHSVQVFDISLIGVCFTTNIALADSLKTITGPFKFIISLANNSEYEVFGQICWQHTVDSVVKIGMRFFNTFDHERVDILSDSNDTDLSDCPLLILGESSSLDGLIYKTHFFKETARVKIVGLNRKRMRILIKSSEILLFEKMKIEITFYLKKKEVSQIPGEVTKLISCHDDKVILDLQINELSDQTERELVKYLIHQYSWSPNEIRNSGFKIKEVSDAFRFRSVSTHEEYLEVLELRLTAYQLAKKVQDGTTAAKMRAQLDHKSRIITVYHKERLVASVAITFPDLNSLVLDTERALPNGYPPNFPQKIAMVEVSRLCTHPDYRKGDIIPRLFAHVMKVFLISDRQYIYTSCDDTLWQLYKRIGFRKTGVSYPHPTLNNIPHHIISLNRTTLDSGKGINPLAWTYFFGDMIRYIEDRKKITRTPLNLVKAYLYRTIAKLTKFLMNQK